MRIKKIIHIRYSDECLANNKSPKNTGPWLPPVSLSSLSRGAVVCAGPGTPRDGLGTQGVSRCHPCLRHEDSRISGFCDLLGGREESLLKGAGCDSCSQAHSMATQTSRRRRQSNREGISQAGGSGGWSGSQEKGK